MDDGAAAAAAPAARHGHRPLLTPDQALQIAHDLFGISPCAAAATSGPGGAAGGEATCVELPSYDDRNFRIRVASPHLQLQPLQLERQDADPQRQRAQRPQPDDEPKPCYVVLKVHNTRDSYGIGQLQAQDAAMLRLQAAGVLTNTPLRPLHAATRCGPPQQQPGGDSVPPAAAGRLPCRVAPAEPTDGDDYGGGDAEGRCHTGFGLETVATEPSCWALLPCTCHPDPAPASDLPATAQPRSATSSSSSPPGEAAYAQTADGVAAGGPGQQEAGGPGQQEAGGPGQQEAGGPGQQEAGTALRQAGLGQGGGGGGGAPTPNLEGRRWHVVRCLRYVPGRMLSSVEALTPRLLRSLGRMLGRVTAALAGWRPPALAPCARSDWHPESGAEVLRRLVPGLAVFDQEQRSLLLQVAAELQEAAPRLADAGLLPRQLCHADANDDNCVLSEDGLEVAGLIDFGDMAVMSRVCEVAITMLYAMLLALDRPMGQPHPTAQPSDPGFDSGDAQRTQSGAADAVCCEEQSKGEDKATLQRLLAAGGLVLAGYMEVVPLGREELAALPLLLRGRLAQSLALGAASVAADPGNAAYLMQTQRPGWRVIRLLTPGSILSEAKMLQYLLCAGASKHSNGPE